MDLKQLRIVVVLAEELHFGRAADRLHLAQPALSARLRALEEDLGVDLFARNSRTVALTRAGEAILPEALAALAHADAAVHAARDASNTGTLLKIAGIDSATAGLLPQIVRRFRKTHDVEVRIEEMLSASALYALEHRAADLAFSRNPGDEAAFIARLVLREPLVCILPTDDPLAGQDSVRLEEIAPRRLVLPTRAHRPLLAATLEAWFAAGGHTLRLAQAANERHMIMAMVAAGLGLSIAPAWIANFGGADTVVRPIEGAPRVDTYAVWRRGERFDPLDAFLAHLPDAVD
ncbi:LysR substrate-binding domain-containing protein [uncultured Jannaschia sp.]|uniref:LysR substrate-binding domain-containing protein n=1 Tax=uncultured Jannaschia sp. TaxID=293347 RepID=UPI002628BEC5|nr:LysR substrate-binding domain-containing protein [uncultured Jannaschia sp.]